MIALVALVLLAQTGDGGGNPTPLSEPTTPPLMDAPAQEQQQEQVQNPPPIEQQQAPPRVETEQHPAPEVHEHFEGPAFGPTGSLYVGLPPLATGAPSSSYAGFRFGARLWPSGEKPLAMSFQLGVEASGGMAMTGTVRVELAGRAGAPYVVPYLHAGLTGTAFTVLPDASRGQEYGVRVGLSLGWCLWALQNDTPTADRWSGWNWAGGGGDGALVALLVVLLVTTPDLQLVYEHRENSPIGRIDSGRVEIGVGF